MKNWTIENNLVKTGVTETGGYLDPVTFKLNEKEVSPLSKAPWVDEQYFDESIPPMLRMLQNDFFCAPFGDSDILPDENRAHGATANSKWNELKTTSNKIELQLDKKIMGASVRKIISIVEDHPVIYEEHIFSGGEGELPVGHHLMLKADSLLKLSFSHWVFGGTPPYPVESNPKLGRSLLKYPQEFDDLTNVNLATGNKVDLSNYPVLEKSEEILMLIADDKLPFSWSAVVNNNEGWLLFAIKYPRVLRNTILWLSNEGRDYPPFSRRHKNVIGIEEVTGFYHLGHKASISANYLKEKGYPTSIELNREKEFKIKYLFGVLPVTSGFGKVRLIEPYKDGINITDENKNKIFTKVNLKFIEEN